MGKIGTRKKSISVFIVLSIMVILVGVLFWNWSQISGDKISTSKTENSEYNPIINPNNLVSQIDNPYFTLKPGTKFIYENKTSESLERIEVEVLPDLFMISNRVDLDC